MIVGSNSEIRRRSNFQMRDEFEAEDFCTVVFDEFFFSSINSDNTVRHLLRLLWFVHPKVAPNRLENLLKLAEPSSASASDLIVDPTTKMYNEVKEKVRESLFGRYSTDNFCTFFVVRLKPISLRLPQAKTKRRAPRIKSFKNFVCGYVYIV